MFSARIKQGKASSVAGLLGGLLFLGIGVLVVIPTFGGFGVVWTIVAGIIATYHAIALFSRRGVALYDVEGSDTGRVGSGLSERLADLEEAKDRGLITAQEYEAQRARIISNT